MTVRPRRQPLAGARQCPTTTISGSIAGPSPPPSPDAQRWFDRGLNWTYGFNHEEAIRCFEQALDADPGCADGALGHRLRRRPELQQAVGAFDPVDLAATTARCFAATAGALALARQRHPGRAALITRPGRALSSASPPDDLPSWSPGTTTTPRRCAASTATIGDDLDIVGALRRSADEPHALAALGPDHRRTRRRGRARSKRGRCWSGRWRPRRAATHPGVLHMYIHLMEMSPYPERALRAADWLRELVPDAGHLQHMPTHIDVLCGHYHNVIDWNHAAIIADRKFLERAGAMNFYTALSRPQLPLQDLRRDVPRASTGRRCEAADELIATIPEELLRVRSPPMADWLEAFVPMGLHVLIRFGKWREIIDTPLPGDQEPLLRHHRDDPLRQRRGLRRDRPRRRGRAQSASCSGPRSAGCPRRATLRTTPPRHPRHRRRRCWMARLEYRRGNYDVAFAHLRRSIELEDSLPYDEPWGWMQPTRHAYGALLARTGPGRGGRSGLPRRSRAGRHAWPAPASTRRTSGACTATTSAWCDWASTNWRRMIKQRLDLALARADVPIESSCYCRTTHHAAADSACCAPSPGAP